MGSRTKNTKKTKKMKRIKKPQKIKINKNQRFMKRSTDKLFRALVIFVFSFIPLNLIFATKSPLPIELYFFIIYLTSVIFALLIGFVLYINTKVRVRKNLKISLLGWFGRIIFLSILLADVKIFVLPMTLDTPIIITEHYKKVTGTVMSIETDDGSKERGRYKWYEIIKYVYFVEQTSGKTIKITFHANQSNIGYNIRTIYYLPHTKWGVKTE